MTLSRSRGLTLLEVLVALAVLSLLMAVLMGGWLQAMQAQSRLSEAAERVLQRQQIAQQLRRLVAEALEPDGGNGRAFTGLASQLMVETTSAPEPTAGPAPLASEISFSGSPPRLRVQVIGQEAVVYPWRLERVAISYLDAGGRAHDRWPPLTGIPDPGATPVRPLPALLQFSLQLAGDPQPLVVLAAPRASGWWPRDGTPPIMGLETP